MATGSVYSGCRRSDISFSHFFGRDRTSNITTSVSGPVSVTRHEPELMLSRRQVPPIAVPPGNHPPTLASRRFNIHGTGGLSARGCRQDHRASAGIAVPLPEQPPRLPLRVASEPLQIVVPPLSVNAGWRAESPLWMQSDTQQRGSRPASGGQVHLGQRRMLIGDKGQLVERPILKAVRFLPGSHFRRQRGACGVMMADD